MAESPALSMGHARALHRLSLAPSRLSNMAMSIASTTNAADGKAKASFSAATLGEGDESASLLMDMSLGDLNRAKKQQQQFLNSSPFQKKKKTVTSKSSLSPSKKAKMTVETELPFGDGKIEELERMAKEAMEEEREARRQHRRRRATRESIEQHDVALEEPPLSSSSPTPKRKKSSPRKTLLNAEEESKRMTISADRDTPIRRRKSVAWAQVECDNTPPSAAVPLHSSPEKQPQRSILVNSPSRQEQLPFSSNLAPAQNLGEGPKAKEQKRYRLGPGPVQARSISTLSNGGATEIHNSVKTNEDVEAADEELAIVTSAKSDEEHSKENGGRSTTRTVPLVAEVAAKERIQQRDSASRLAPSPQAKVCKVGNFEDCKAISRKKPTEKVQAEASKETYSVRRAENAGKVVRSEVDAEGGKRHVARAENVKTTDERCEMATGSTRPSSDQKPMTRQQQAAEEASQLSKPRSKKPTGKIAPAVKVFVPQGYRLSSTGQLVATLKTKEFSFSKSATASSSRASRSTSEGSSATVAARGGPKANPIPAWLQKRREVLKQEEAARLEAELERVRIEELHKGQVSAPLRTRATAAENVENVPLAAPGAFVSSVEARLAERAAWEVRRREKEEALERQREAARLERQQREDEEYREARKRSVPKANPVPAWLHQRR